MLLHDSGGHWCDDEEGGIDKDGGDGSLWLYLIILEINTSESESESFSVRGEPLRWLKLRLPRGILLHFQVENFIEKHLDIEKENDLAIFD